MIDSEAGRIDELIAAHYTEDGSVPTCLVPAECLAFILIVLSSTLFDDLRQNSKYS